MHVLSDFQVVQIAPNLGEQNIAFPLIWSQQYKAVNEIPNSGIISTIDIGFPCAPDGAHPANKRDVGLRLALLALNKTYKMKNIVFSGPTYKSVRIDGSKIIVSFDNCGSGLCVKDANEPDNFEIAGDNKKFIKAKAVIEGNTVVVSAPAIKNPLYVRYAWSGKINPNLQNKEGLPATPFGTMPEINLLSKVMPEVEKEYKLVYNLNPLNAAMKAGKTKITYIDDNSDKLKNVKFQKIAYFMAMEDKEGKLSYALVTLDAFTNDIKKIGVPTKATNARFQQNVTGMTVKSNVEGIKNGTYPEGGNIEFWDCNYGPYNSEKVPDASDKLLDFGDQMNIAKSPGYGCMQIHNWKEKQSVICFNNFSSSIKDVGIGNWNGKSRDWTFSGSAENYAGGELKVLIK